MGTDAAGLSVSATAAAALAHIAWRMGRVDLADAAAKQAAALRFFLEPSARRSVVKRSR